MTDAAGLPSTLTAWLSAHADSHATCIHDAGVAVDWSQLVRRSRGMAAGLASIGVGYGDRVGLWLPNRTAWLVGFFACAQLGAIAVSINTRYRSAEVGDLLRRSGASVLVCWPGFKAIDFAGILAQCGEHDLQHLQAIVVYSEDGAAPPATIAGKRAVSYASLIGHEPHGTDHATAQSPCIMFTTSGTTKAPKMVLHKHANVLGHARNAARQYGLGQDKRFLLVPPFCGVFGMCSAMAALVSDSLLVLDAVWEPARFADLIDEHKITHVVSSNEALGQLLAERSAQRPFPSLELVGQANLNPAHADITEQADARGIRAAGLYGSSEVQAIFSLCDPKAPPDIRGRAGGVPASAVAQVRARDTETQALCAHGEPGELEFLAPQSCFVEYFHNPQATAEAFTGDGWFRSGDLGFTEPDGGFIYLARMGDTLRLGGFLVSPAEIEAVIQEHPQVESCQVVGARTAEAVKPFAFVLTRGAAPFDEAAVIAHVGSRLARYKVPVRVVAVDEFPTTPSANGSKVQKTKLRDMADALLASGSN
jgi:fatty-acyl-CoA synthase